MHVNIDGAGCIGCGLCVSTSAEIFAMGDDQKAKVMLSPIPPMLEAKARESAESCPSGVISITE